jgi:hypothetical protein
MWSFGYVMTEVGDSGLGGAERREMRDPLGSSLWYVWSRGGGGSAGGRLVWSIRSSVGGRWGRESSGGDCDTLLHVGAGAVVAVGVGI